MFRAEKWPLLKSGAVGRGEKGKVEEKKRIRARFAEGDVKEEPGMKKIRLDCTAKGGR